MTIYDMAYFYSDNMTKNDKKEQKNEQKIKADGRGDLAKETDGWDL